MSESAPPENSRSTRLIDGSTLAPIILLLLFGLIAWASHVRYRPPSPLPASAPSTEFSAARAREILERLVGDGIPHEAGSAQNDVVRDRILDLVTSWGYQPELHTTTFDSSRRQAIIPLDNILFRKMGSKPGAPILLVAHYDSHPNGPGASDDGVGLSAVLEIARMISQEPAWEREVRFLISDGEEFGLLGARKWVEEHPWSKEIGIAINLEARGTTGGSLMFETGDESQWLIQQFQAASLHPLTSSLFFEVYKYLPNDTDFSALKEGGITGFNFAFIGEVRNYHTPQDSFENVDLGSLQHHGQNTLSLARRLSTHLPETIPAGRAVYFDLFGYLIVWWPAWCSLLLALVGLAIWVIPLFLFEKWATAREVFKALFQMFLCLSGAVLAAWLAGFALQQDPNLELAWLDHPVPVELAYWFAALTAIGFLVAWMRPTNPRLWLIVVSGVWVVMGLLTSIQFTGGSYLFVIPAIALSIPLWLNHRLLLAAGMLAASCLCGIMWIPLERLFHDAFGFTHPLVLSIRVAVGLSFLMPLLCLSPQGQRWIKWIGVAGFVLSAALAVGLHWNS